MVGALHEVGYDNDVQSFKEKNSMEENLRNIWRYYPSDPNFTAKDARKNIELLILLRNFDFIAEGLQSKASADNPYYDDWPRDSQYNTQSKAVAFSDEEVLWLMLLLPDSGIPDEHLGLDKVVAECGKNVLERDLSDPGTSEGIWFYYAKTTPGLLEKIDSDFPDYLSDEIKTAFKNADDDIQNRFMQAIDPENFKNIYYTKSPVRVYSFEEAEELIKEYPPEGLWEGGYIRVVHDPSHREGIDKYGISEYNINTSAYGAYTYARESEALAPVINPADACFAVYEEYTDGEYYATYTGRRDFDVYRLNLNIRIVNLLTGEEIFRESALSNPPPDEISWPSYDGIGQITRAEGKYYYNDFDWSRYAAVMEENCKMPVSSIRQER